MDYWEGKHDRSFQSHTSNLFLIFEKVNILYIWMIKTSITSFSVILLRISAHLIQQKYKINNLGFTFFSFAG